MQADTWLFFSHDEIGWLCSRSPLPVLVTPET
jgi:hypothetical protein